ncbi:MAG: MBOAT family O-acyltransferase [Flavobacteriales bacterium]
MLGNALYFFLFIALTLLLFYKSRFPLLVLFFASLIFIACIEWRAVPLLLMNALLSFYVAQRMVQSQHKNLLFILSLSFILVELLVFKYFALSGSLFSSNHFVFALGLSFYSLQHIAYLFDVKIGRSAPEQNALSYVVASAYFPKILCGPVVTYQQMKNALPVRPLFREENMVAGFKRFILGAFKKLVLANHLALMTAAIFDNPEANNGFISLFAGVLFTLQVYFDFSGYIDMALGISRCFGIELPENFARPLRSISVTQFWRRWHITLMQWLTHYVYYPVSYFFRQNAFLSAFAGIVITLLFSAFWHGLGCTFFLWALCHIVYLSIELVAQRAKLKLLKALTFVLTIFAVSFANIFFRSSDITTAQKMMGEIFSVQNFWPSDWLVQFVALIGKGAELNDLFNFSACWIFVLLFLSFENRINREANRTKFSIGWLTLFILLIFVFGIFNSGEQFIYSRF